MGKPLKKHHLLFALSKDQRDLVDAMLIKGDSAPTVAARIQTEWKLHEEIPAGTLIKALNRYRKDCIQGQLIHKFEVQDAAGVIKVETIQYEEYRPRLHAHTLIQDAIILQMSRLAKIIAQERPLPSLLPAAKEELKLFMLMVGELKDLELGLGLLTKIPDRKDPNTLHPDDVEVIGDLMIAKPELKLGLSTLISDTIKQLESEIDGD